jgi:hypothetical protein
MRFFRAAVILLLAVVGLAASPDAQPFEKTEPGPGDAALTLRLNATRFALADDATLTLTIEAPAPVEVEKVAPLTPSRSWLVAAGEPETTPLAGNRMRWRQEFRLSALQAGAVPLPLAPLHYRTGAGDPHDFVWPAPTMQVSTTVLRPLVGEARDNTPPDLDLPPEFWNPWRLAVARTLLCALDVVLAVILWRLRRNWKPKERRLTVDEQALADLDRLGMESEATPDAADSFSIRLAEILRRYLEAKFSLPPSGRSTAELLTALDATGRLPTELREEMAALLARCDLAKFARVDFGPEERRTTTEQAGAWIRRLPTALLPERVPETAAATAS